MRGPRDTCAGMVNAVTLQGSSLPHVIRVGAFAAASAQPIGKARARSQKMHVPRVIELCVSPNMRIVDEPLNVFRTTLAIFES